MSKFRADKDFFFFPSKRNSQLIMTSTKTEVSTFLMRMRRMSLGAIATYIHTYIQMHLSLVTKCIITALSSFSIVLKLMKHLTLFKLQVYLFVNDTSHDLHSKHFFLSLIFQSISSSNTKHRYLKKK